MIIDGKLQIVVNGTTTRVLGRDFNVALKTLGDRLTVHDTNGNVIVPSKNLTWSQVANAVRQGKKVQAKTTLPQEHKAIVNLEKLLTGENSADADGRKYA